MSKTPNKLVLASKSPRRRQLLSDAGLTFDRATIDVEEDYPKGLDKGDIAEFLANKKLDAYRHSYPDVDLICADTTVVLNDTLLEKSGSAAEAASMLHQLSGKWHQVITGVALWTSGQCVSFKVVTDVQFKVLEPEMIEKYIQKYKPYDKAGSYGIQELLDTSVKWYSPDEALFMQKMDNFDLYENTLAKDNTLNFINQIKGSYFNVVGLPVVEVMNHLEDR